MSNSGVRIDNYIQDLIRGDSDSVSLPPVDEVFTDRSHPTTTTAFVENRQETPEARAKANEIAEDRAASTSTAARSQLSSPALSAVSLPESESEMAPLAAPPDYATATADRPRARPDFDGVTSPQTTYSSFRQGASDTTTANATESQPRSMSDARQRVADEETGLLTQKKKSRSTRSCWSRWCSAPLATCRTILVIALIIVIIILAAAPGGHTSNDGSHVGAPGNPDRGKLPSSPNQPTPWFPHSNECPYDVYTDVLTYDFADLDNFAFLELMEETEYLSHKIQGKVIVRPAKDVNQEADIRIQIRYATTSPWQVVSSKCETTQDSFVLHLPKVEGSARSRSGRPCLGVFASIDVRPGLTLNDWTLTTGNLNIEVVDGLFSRKSSEILQGHMQITGKSTFNAVSGACKIAHWSARHTIIETISGSIHGFFDLLDLLSLKTTSGTIGCTVDPKDADPDAPAPAYLSVTSISGTVDVRLPTTGSLPERDYQTRLETVSSNIRGAFIHGSSTSIHTSSGDVHIELLPYVMDSRTVPSIHTSTHSGTTAIRVLPPQTFPGDSWGKLRSEHKSSSISGTMHITYPDEWEGLATADSTSGTISIRGRDVKIIGDSKSAGAFRHVVARKGDGMGRIGVRTVSGTIDVRIGE
ncbi:unnamed protein product [Zymoseptoria tritici ST99CH_1E4]|uniref:Adhesin domain-containing protein n=1 Tax=Zymoseptoria tritici ST99CH_1E4 TaxID=1276532 RepID=A0A2H1FLH1_ZYMTR|nr:unnamed protein product [Zymoseptoria tritici ST99CH_1E4]